MGIELNNGSAAISTAPRTSKAISNISLWLRPDSSPDPSLRATLHRPFKSSANSQTSPSPKSVVSSGISPAVCVLLHTPLAPANAARFARGIPSRAPIGSSATELSRHASKNLPLQHHFKPRGLMSVMQHPPCLCSPIQADSRGQHLHRRLKCFF